MSRKTKSSCLLCGSSNIRNLFNAKDRMLNIPGEFKVSRCKKCGFVFLNPIPDEKTLKKYYPSKDYYAYSDKEDEGFFSKVRNYLISHYYNRNILSRLIASVVHDVPGIPLWKQNGKILDIGCGSGETLVMLKKLGWEVYGLDIDKKALDVAKKKGVTHVKFGTYKAISTYPDNFFDAVRMYHVIEHLDNPYQVLGIIHKKLKKNGELIIGTPNTKSFTAGIFRQYWLNLDTPRHTILFNPVVLKKLLKKENYKVTAVDFCSAGGIVGSMGYFFSEQKKYKINLLDNMFLVLLFYPFEWVLDKLHYGDIFVIKARKMKN